MPSDHLEADIETMQDTKEFAHICTTVAGNSFGVQFVLEDNPTDMFDESVEGANAFIVVETKHVVDIATGVMLTIGTVPDDDFGSGRAGTDLDDLMIDTMDMDPSADTQPSTEGVYKMYVIRISQYGDDDLMKQIFLSKDKQ